MDTTRRAALIAALAAPALGAPVLAGRATAQPGPAGLPQVPLLQAPGWYRFKVGGFTVTTVFDGFSRRTVAGLVDNAPLEAVQATLAEQYLSTESYDGPYTVTFVDTGVDTGRQLIAFDAGTGGQLTPTSGLLLANMAAAGLDPAKVGLVIVTHCHQDHIHGLATKDGAAVFPNAELAISDVEYAWWSDPGNESRSPPGQRVNFANVARRFAPYQGRIRRFAAGAEVTPGIRSLAAYGHTPGHCIFRVADGAEQVMVLADTTHRPEVFVRHPEMHSLFEFDADAAEATRSRILDVVATDRLPVIGYHFPFPAAGHILRDGPGYRYVRADWG